MKQLAYDDKSYYQNFPSNILAFKNKGLDILLVSQDLSKSGAPRVLVEIAKHLKNLGHFVLVVSPIDGPRRNELNEMGIMVVIDSLILNNHEYTIRFYKNFDKVILNTLVTMPFINNLYPYAEMYLYIHESKLIDEFASNDNNFAKNLTKVKKIWANGKLSKSFLDKYINNVIILDYGTPDLINKNKDIKKNLEDDKIIISIFGSYESRKGQDIAIEAIKLLPDKFSRLCKFNFYGRVLDINFYNKLLISSENLLNVYFNDDSGDYFEKLLNSNLILIPSRDESLSLVGIDALSGCIPIITSNQVGISQYLKNQESAFIVDNLTAEQIKNALISAIQSREVCNKIVKNGRQIYINFFSEKNFANNLVKEIFFH
jgi:glycosyltransferase involved in cell wall biosynthesis